jgi:hypothetical protein
VSSTETNSVEDQLTVDLKYLQHFWDPEVGDCTKLPSGDSKVITQILDPQHPQVRLEESDIVHYLQDLDWVPDESKFAKLLENKFSVKVFDDSVAIGKTWFKRPTTISELATIIRQVRMLGVAFSH